MAHFNGFYNNGEPLTVPLSGLICKTLSPEQVIQNRALHKKAKLDARLREQEYEKQAKLASELRRIAWEASQTEEDKKRAKAKQEADLLRKEEEIVESKVHANLANLPKFQGQLSFSVRWYSLSKTLEIEYRSYCTPEFNFENLCRISEAVGTRNINFASSLENEGCPSCADGREWSFTLVCKNPTIPD